LGRSWAAPALRNGVETVSGPVVEAFHEMPVAVRGHLDRGVSEAGLDRLGVFAGGYQPGGVSVAEVVYPAWLSHRLGHPHRPGVEPVLFDIRLRTFVVELVPRIDRQVLGH
jgi:hypothetical protein